MNYLKYTQYVYLIFGAYFIYDGFTKVNEPALGNPWLSFMIAGLAVFMFFFRRKFAKKFEDRNKNSQLMEVSIIILCLILSAFFSGMEIAFVSSNKIYLEIEKKQDNFLSKILTKLTEKPTNFIVTMLIGNTIAMVVYGFFMGDVVLQWCIAL